MDSANGYFRAYELQILGDFLYEGPTFIKGDKGSLTIDVWYDYDDDTIVDSFRFSPDVDLGSGKLRLRLPLSRRKIQSLRIRIGFFSTAEPIAFPFVYYSTLTLTHVSIEAAPLGLPSKVANSDGS